MALNMALVVGSGFHPSRVCRASQTAGSQYQQLKDAGAADDELDAFKVKTGMLPVALFWVAAMGVELLLRPSWFGL